MNRAFLAGLLAPAVPAWAASAERPALLEQIQRRLAVVNPYRLLGQATQPVTYRDSVSGVLSSPVPV